jgi:hypothetical protein
MSVRSVSTKDYERIAAYGVQKSKAKQSQFPRGPEIDPNSFAEKGLCKFVSKQRNLKS